MRRSSMLLIVGFCCAVASPAAAQPQSPAEKAAKAELEKLGVRFYWPELLRGEGYPAWVPRNSTVTDADLQKLKDLPGLVELRIGYDVVGFDRAKPEGLTKPPARGISSKITDEGMKHVAGLTNLRGLSLQSDKIGDRGLVHVEGLRRLESLDVGSSKVTDEGMKSIGRLTQLRALRLDCPALTDAGLKELHGLKNVERLYIDHFELSDAAIAALKAKMPRLKADPQMVAIVKLPISFKARDLVVTPEDDAETRLLKLKFNAATEAFDAQFRGAMAHTYWPDPSVNFYRILGGIIEVACELGDFPERDLILKGSAEALEMLGKYTEAEYEAGKIGAGQIAIDRYERLTLKIRLLEIKQAKAK
jgi:hypothetical protein